MLSEIFYTSMNISCRGNKRVISEVSELVGSLEQSNFYNIPYHSRVDRKTNGGFDYSLRIVDDVGQINRLAQKLVGIKGVKEVLIAPERYDE